MFVKLAPNSKVPVEGEWQLSPEPWSGFNNGLILKDRVVVDFDELDAAREFFRLHSELCSVMVRTRRGIHAHFSGTTRARRFEHGDLKHGEHSYVLMPFSVVNQHRYVFIRNGELLPFPEHLFPDTQKEVVRKEIKNVRAYIARIESIQGKNGSAGLVRAAARCRDAGLSEAESTIAMLDWNDGPTVSPPWKPEDIARAVTRVFKKGSE